MVRALSTGNEFAVGLAFYNALLSTQLGLEGLHRAKAQQNKAEELGTGLSEAKSELHKLQGTMISYIPVFISILVYRGLLEQEHGIHPVSKL